MKTCINLIRDKRGGSMVEFAVSAPLLFLLCAGAGDYARLFFSAISLKSGSNVGAFYGSQEAARSGDIAGMTSRALDDAADAARFNGVTATADQYCVCPGMTAFPCGEYQTTTCPAGYGNPRAYVRVRATQSFRPLAPFFGVPESVNVDQMTWMRVR
ncbi:MAG: pilus assembly protein [Acidobacteria bacterium]|nr:pilus assembly protein [Acidobacteriota bacterium]